MASRQRGTRGETTQPSPGYEVIRTEGRYSHFRLHLHDFQPGATAYTHADGSVVSSAKRTSAVLYLYQQFHMSELPPHKEKSPI